MIGGLLCAVLGLVIVGGFGVDSWFLCLWVVD